MGLQHPLPALWSPVHQLRPVLQVSARTGHTKPHVPLTTAVTVRHRTSASSACCVPRAQSPRGSHTTLALVWTLVLGAVDSPDPDQNPNGSLTGADVVEEQLREICIFQIANQTVAKDSAARYFVYMTLFTAQCSGLNFTGDCSLQQQVAAGRWPFHVVASPASPPPSDLLPYPLRCSWLVVGEPSLSVTHHLPPFPPLPSPPLPHPPRCAQASTRRMLGHV